MSICRNVSKCRHYRDTLRDSALSLSIVLAIASRSLFDDPLAPVSFHLCEPRVKKDDGRAQDYRARECLRGVILFLR